MKLSAPIFRLKRRAKLLARKEQIALNEALNRIAKEEGFANWSLLSARYAKLDPAMSIFARLAPGDLLLLGARPLQGKTVLALNILAQACKAGRGGALFSLEFTTAEALDALKDAGVAPEAVLVDTSDAISAEHIIAQLGGMKAGAVIVIDYLQLLDEQREKAPLAAQVAALKSFARKRGLIFVFISQIDRRYDATAKALPDIHDVRLPNKLDVSLFTKTCFLREGELVFNSPGPVA